MSDAPDQDLLAAEYVLGTLEGQEAETAARLLKDDAAFATAVRAWEERLTPLAAAVEPVPPALGLWERIEETTASAEILPFSFRRRRLIWQLGSGVAVAAVAMLAVFGVPHRPPPPRVVMLTPVAAGAPMLRATINPGGTLSLQPDGTITVPSDHDLELWALNAGETRPRSLGLIPAAGGQLMASLSPGTQLLVSLEPRGGSPTGQPTGPVVYGGRLD